MTASIRKIACAAVAAVGLTGATAQAATLNYEGFDYATGSGLTGQTGGSGWNGGWILTGTSQNNTVAGDANSLTYPVGFESPLSPPPTTGSRIATAGPSANASNTRLLAETIPLNVDGTVAYASALFRKNVANGSTNADNVLLEFTDSAGNRRWGLGIEGTGDKPWLNANGSTTPSAGPAVTAGDTYLIVAKIVSSASGTDQAFLKVYGTGYGTEVAIAEPTTWDATLTQTTGAILDRVRLRVDSGNAAGSPGEIDEIRIGDSWNAVVLVPEPATGAVLAAGGALALTTRGGRRRGRDA